VLKKKGPFNIKGVGGTSVQVQDEFMVTVNLADGTRQVMEGYSTDRITDALPFVDLRQAEHELKTGLPNNNELQSLQCPDQIGGDVDVLVGILYQNIFPKAVFTLENGLTIYEMRVKSHDASVNAVIGGPHPSFRHLAQNIGDVSILFANLSRQLQNYQQFGPPQIERALICKDVRLSEETLKLAHYVIDGILLSILINLVLMYVTLVA